MSARGPSRVVCLARTAGAVTSVLALAGALATAACGGGAGGTDTKADQAAGAGAKPEGLAAAARGMAEAAEAFKDATGTAATPVGADRLAALLVEIPGWTRSEPTSEQLTVPFAHAQAEARYQRGEDAQVAIRLTDTALNQMLLAPFSVFLQEGFEERTASGFKRFARVEGQPAIEEWDGRTSVGEITVVVGGRILANARGTRVPDLDTVRGVLRRLDFRRLATLAEAR
ncbi:MAG: hypothetical protein R2752_20735 [Vicinamibacterales bacterium]